MAYSWRATALFGTRWPTYTQSEPAFQICPLCIICTAECVLVEYNTRCAIRKAPDCMRASGVCIFPASLKRDSVQSQRYGCNFCCCLIIIASSGLHDAHPAHWSCSAGEKQPACLHDFWPYLLSTAHPLSERLKHRLMMVTNDESSW